MANQVIHSLISTLNSALNPQDYTTNGLIATKCTFDRGGYCKIGKIVIVNIRITINEIGPSISGFPRPIYLSGFSGYDGTNERAAFGYLNTNGLLSIPSAYGNTGAVSVSFVYITSD